MSPQAGQLLVNEIVPKLRSVIPRSIKGVGCEDNEELIQDATAMAAKLLHNNEASGKPTALACIAYFTLQHVKAGRRSYSAGRSDALNSSIQLDGNSLPVSTDEVLAYDEMTGESITFGKSLSNDRDDPAQVGARQLDWVALGTQGKRAKMPVRCAAEGRQFREVARHFKVSDTSISESKKLLATALRQFMGRDLEELNHPPVWRKPTNQRIA